MLNSFLFIIIKKNLFVLLIKRLENSLRNFATLTKGDVISINYNDKVNIHTHKFKNRATFNLI